MENPDTLEWTGGAMTLGVWKSKIVLMTEIPPKTKLDIQMVRRKEGGFAVDIREDNRFGFKSCKTSLKKELALPWRVDVPREELCCLPQFALSPLALTKRCKGLYQAIIKATHLLPWPDSPSDIYRNQKELREQKELRRRSAVRAGETMSEPSHLALAIMNDYGIDYHGTC